MEMTMIIVKRTAVFTVYFKVSLALIVTQIGSLDILFV